MESLTYWNRPIFINMLLILAAVCLIVSASLRFSVWSLTFVTHNAKDFIQLCSRWLQFVAKRLVTGFVGHLESDLSLLWGVPGLGGSNQRARNINFKQRGVTSASPNHHHHNWPLGAGPFFLHPSSDRGRLALSPHHHLFEPLPTP